jgi:integrase
MRRGEILQLQWSFVDLEADFIRLPNDLTKEHKSKNIPINHHVKADLNSIPRPIHHDFVFNYRSKPINPELGIKDTDLTGFVFGLAANQTANLQAWQANSRMSNTAATKS